MVDSSRSLETHEASCLCGDVRWQLEGELQAMVNCHCSICRKFHGSAYGTYVGGSADSFLYISGEESIASWNASEGHSRLFCERCGSVAPLVTGGQAFFAAGNLDTTTSARPETNIFVGSKAPWHSIEDELRCFDDFPDAWQGVPTERVSSVTSEGGWVRGSCLCDGVAWETDGELAGVYSCHCQRCRKGRSAAHASNVFCDAATFRWIRGKSLVRAHKVPEADRFGVAFCSVCGSSQPRASQAGASLRRMVIPAGAIDGDPGLQEIGHIFVGSKADWHTITDELPQYQEYDPR